MRLESIGCEMGRNKVLNEIHEIPGIAVIDGEIFISRAILEGVEGWTACKEIINRTLGLIASYELKEATTVFELVLRKAKMAEENMADDAGTETCLVGEPGPVKLAILQFFPSIRMQ
mmetsp:Transcript_39876/g.68031  ORF Transcript_39876/g.68031 Transcript_39876/m.68031 type:complete len:117 (+) Transcript_39876:173-523(+)